MSEYVLGRNAAEHARLCFQQEVWGATTSELLDRSLGEDSAALGKSCLDVGCGPGLVTLDLARRVGAEGSVLGLDGATHWLAALEAAAGAAGLENVATREVELEQLELPSRAYDFAFARWVFSFLADPGALLAELARGLRPGAILAIEDYNHEGVSLFPPSRGFDAVIRATRALYSAAGGDVWVAGSLPALLEAAGFEVLEERSTVLHGGPESPAFRWADAFFPAHVPGLVERGLLEADEHDLFLREWEERKASPTARFYSPIVVDLIARRR
jgi:SAM-dependent methyltransferase